MPDANGDAEASFTAGDAQSSFEQGNELAARGELDAAEAAYRRADEAGHPTAAAYAGVFSESRGETAAAEAAYRRADERGDGFGAFKLGLLRSHRGNWSEASEAWKRAEERGYEHPPFDARALIYGKAGEGAAAASAAAERTRSPFTSPVLVGAMMVLVALVAVFLAYNANKGLPFVPTKELRIDIANGSNLVVGNAVREGGYNIGLISNLKPIQLRSGQVGAQLTLKLSQANGDVPADSTATVLPASVLGLKYVSLNLGTSRRLIPDGGILPISRTSVPVQFEDVFKTFDAKTRGAIQQDLVGVGDTLAARGSAINDTVSSLPQLFAHLQPVASYLAAPNTQLTRLFETLNAFMGAVSPVAQTNARLFTDMASTFEAIQRDPKALEATISQSPSTIDVSTTSLKAQQPFLADFTALGHNLQPASAALVGALPQINPAVENGTRSLKRAPVLNANLDKVLASLKDLALAPGTNIALNGLTSTAGTLNPIVKYLGPFQTVCDDWNYWWTYLAEHISEETTFGFAQRVQFMATNPLQPNNVMQQGAPQPANGGIPDTPLGGNEFLANLNYGASIDNRGNADCEVGQRGLPKKLNYFDPKGRNLVVDQHTPGNQGPSFGGRPHVPAGETFTRNPLTGPQPAYNPSNP
jgi:virulence factor Mce-like protein